MSLPVFGWMLDAACEGADLDLFYGLDGERGPVRAARIAEAKTVCAGCPVRTDCLDYAVCRPENYGVFGGTDEEERATMRRNHLRRIQNQRRSAA
jgi:WhiB family transcriptional regulator, redox-sensing transcriptional regulator